MTRRDREISVSLPPELAAWLEHHSRRIGVAKAVIVRGLIETYAARTSEKLRPKDFRNFSGTR